MAIPAKWALWENQTTVPAENTADGYGDPQRWGLQFQRALTADIAAYQAAGFTVTASQESFLGPGQRGGYMKLLNPQTFAQGPPQNPAYNFAWTKQRGGALVATKYDANGDPTEIAHDVIGMIAIGSDGSVLPTKGGGGGAQPSTGATYNPADAGDVLKSKFVDKSNALGVNLSNGSLSTDSPVNLDVGNGDFPYSLSASASWHPGVIPIVPTPGWQRADGWVPNWNNNLALSGSGMEALGVSDIREAAGAIAAFLAAQDIYKAAPSVQRDVAAVLTQSWWVHQLTGNVATVTLGASSRQFVKLADNSWIAPGPGYATLVQTGTRTATNYICPQPVHSQDPHYAMSRGWDESGLSFAVTNQHGDTQNFGYFEYKYSTDSGFLCARNLGFRLNDWTFPQGVNVHLTYTDVEQTNTPPGENPGYTWQLTQVSTTFGTNTTPARVINFDYDAGGTILLGFDDGNGRSILAGQGTVPSNTDAMGKVTSFAYTLPQHTTATQRPVPYALLSTVTIPDGSGDPHVAYDYDSEGKIKQIQDAEALQVGDRAPYQFLIADGTRGERDDPLYDPINNPSDQGYVVVYDTYGHGSRFIDELGRETDTLFDGRERPVTYTFPEGDCEGFAYDDHNNTTAYTRVDKTGACQVNVAGNHRIQTRATYDQTWNKPLTITTPNSNVTHFVYNASGSGKSLLATATRPADASGLQGVYSFSYDAAGKPTSVSVPFTSGQNIVTSDAYDANENLLTSTLDAGTGHVNAVTSYSYDAIGNVTSTADPRGNVTEVFYDAERRKTESHHHDGSLIATLNQASRTTYDAIGRDVKDESGFTFSSANVLTWQTDKITTYTPTSKVATVKDADNSITATAYDGLDRTDTVSDPVGRKSHFIYDAVGNTLVEYRAWQSLALVQAYSTSTYGADNEKFSIKDANNNTTTYSYDGFNRTNVTTFPDGSTDIVPLATGYDKDSNVLLHTNRAGQTETFTYDTLDRILSRDMPPTVVSHEVTSKWTYYLNGSIYELYDYLDGISSAKNNDIVYGFDTAGRAIGETTTIPGIAPVQPVSYALDASGNRTALIWPDNYCVAYGFDSLNRTTAATEGVASGVVCTPGSTVLATYSYDPLSRRTNLAYPHASVAYSYSPAGDLLTLNHSIAGTGTVPQFTLGYTTAHQLNSEVSSQASYVWQPSANGADTYTAANNLNQYPSWTPAGGTAQGFTYDANGNMTGGTINGAAWTFAYDPENHLLTANKATGGTVMATYAYDPLGRRNKKTGSGVVNVSFLDDGQDEIGEYNASGALTWRYIPGPVTNEPIGAVAVSTGAKRYYQTDHHGSIISVVSTAGSQVEGPFTYDAYGNGQAPSTTEYRYVGMRLDAETGLYYDRARFYCASCARFLQADPVGYAAGLNLYIYSGNDPADRADPTGRDASGPLGKALIRGGAVDALGGGPEDPFGDLAALAAIVYTLESADASRQVTRQTDNRRQPHLLYRALTPKDQASVEKGGGISATDPSANISMDAHVAQGVKPSQYISTTKDPAVAAFYAQGGGVAVINADLLPNKIDLSHGSVALSAQGNANAIRDSEVLATQKIPQSAIMGVVEMKNSNSNGPKE